MWPIICEAGGKRRRYFSAFLTFRLLAPVRTIAQFDRWVGQGSAMDDDYCDIYMLPSCGSDDGDDCGDVKKSENVELHVVLEVCRRTFSEVVEIRFGLYCGPLVASEYVKVASTVSSYPSFIQTRLNCMFPWSSSVHLNGYTSLTSNIPGINSILDLECMISSVHEFS